jgi:hypothetical protein
MWEAIQDVLDSHVPERAAIAWDIAHELCKYSKRSPCGHNYTPSVKIVADLVVVSTEGAWAACKRLRSQYPINVIEVAHVLRSGGYTPDSTKGFEFACVKHKYDELIQEEGNLPLIFGILKTAVLRPDSKSLEACILIRDRYEACRSWTGKDAEVSMLWKLRDDLTSQLLTAPFACEGNLKISLLFPREVPHPGLDREPQPISDAERWILSSRRLLTEGLGIEHAEKIALFADKGELDSSHFIYLGSFPEARFRGIQPVTSRFDLERNVLTPLARSLGLTVQGIWDAALGSDESSETPPRTWLSREEKDRYEVVQVTLACRCVALNYWKPESTDRFRPSAYEFLRALVHQRPYHLAMAIPNIRRTHPDLYRDLSRLVRDEVLDVWRRTPDASGSDHALRGAQVLMDAFGNVCSETSRLSLDELTIALERPSESLMRDNRFSAFIGSVRAACVTSPTFEQRANAAIHEFPDTAAAAQLARNLSEARAPDPSLRALFERQAVRSDLEVRTWLNYAHSAFICGLEPSSRERVREVFEERYERSVRMLGRWSAKGRASFRMVASSLYPDRVGEISALTTPGSKLFQSALETRMMATISGIPQVSVAQDRYIPWAPAIDGVLYGPQHDVPPVVLLIDGERYHSVNGSWLFRGFDGHSLLATKILVNAGYPVLRISGQFGQDGERSALCSVVTAALDYLAHGEPAKDPRLIIDPPDDITNIRGNALLYRPSASHPTRHIPREVASPPFVDEVLEDQDVEEESEGGARAP